MATVASIRKANGLKGDLIRVGTVLRVPKGPFRVRVTKSRHTLQLLQGKKTIKTYRVGLGRGNSTPSGTFAVAAKLVNPTWHNDAGRIPAGTYFVRLVTRDLDLTRKFVVKN